MPTNKQNEMTKAVCFPVGLSSSQCAVHFRMTCLEKQPVSGEGCSASPNSWPIVGSQPKWGMQGFDAWLLYSRCLGHPWGFSVHGPPCLVQTGSSGPCPQAPNSTLDPKLTFPGFPGTLTGLPTSSFQKPAYRAEMPILSL